VLRYLPTWQDPLVISHRDDSNGYLPTFEIRRRALLWPNSSFLGSRERLSSTYIKTLLDSLDGWRKLNRHLARLACHPALLDRIAINLPTEATVYWVHIGSKDTFFLLLNHPSRTTKPKIRSFHTYLAPPYEKNVCRSTAFLGSPL
jgi:hypothetical protein